MSTYKIELETSAKCTRKVFKELFRRCLLLRGVDGDILCDTDPIRLARCTEEGIGTIVQLHDGMSAEEALLLLRAVLGLQVDTIETLGQSIKQIAGRSLSDPNQRLPKTG